MKIITPSRLSSFAALPQQDQQLFWEAFKLLCITRINILMVPFKKLAARMGGHQFESTQAENPSHNEMIAGISKAIKKASLYTPCRSKCFEQALTASAMLKKRKIPSTIYFGVSKNPEDINQLKAHAWIRSGTTILTGAVGHKKFEVVAYFGSNNN